MRELYMKQVVVKTSTYSSDEFGVCSALYELGGMVVMHDASGCNSTYTTHDEPRWYDMDSMIYISAISEMEAIMGDDDKLIRDILETAEALKPKFIAIVGAPIPYMTGTDFAAIANIVEDKAGLFCFGFQTNGMEYYTKGISMALEQIADRFCIESVPKPSDRLRVNILGATPLDFSVNGSVEAIKNWLSGRGFEPGCCFAMGSSLDEIFLASSAHVNLVISYGGLAAAKLLEERFGIPYVIGVPYGTVFSSLLGNSIYQASLMNRSQISYAAKMEYGSESKKQVAIIGESVLSASLASAIEMEHPELNCKVLCPIDTDSLLLRPGDHRTPEEDDISAALRSADLVIADPLY
ncbi:MAG: nitrogenase component 1, partial [Lachnospiraceae bacterium]|nr:nitrogenase component 1 [Lachnospiraceae bacterium]